MQGRVGAAIMTMAVLAALDLAGAVAARRYAEHHRLRSFDTRVVDFTRDRLDAPFDLVVAADVVYEPEIPFSPTGDREADVSRRSSMPRCSSRSWPPTS